MTNTWQVMQWQQEVKCWITDDNIIISRSVDVAHNCNITATVHVAHMSVYTIWKRIYSHSITLTI
jgi:hypothetical protein